MEPGSIKKVITLIVGILVAFFIANTLSDAIMVLTGLKGAAGMIVSVVLYVVFFLAVLHILEKYAHMVFFGFDRE